MATGDTTPRKRARFASNQRLDQPDAEDLSRGPRDETGLVAKSVTSKAVATAGAPVGFIFGGGSVTANPIAINDGKVRLNAELFVALDADGNLLVKPDATTIDATIPPGGADYQVYAYEAEVDTTSAVRQFITSVAPYTEVSQVTATRLTTQVGLHVRVGGLGSIVSEDAIGSANRALVFLGIASNLLGTVTFDPSAQVNRLGSTVGPFTPPANGYSAGSMRTLTEQLAALLYMASRDRWKGARAQNLPYLTLNASNNHGAYSEPPYGLDYAGRAVLAYITIGDGVTCFGDFDLSGYASGDLCLQAAINALPIFGGTILLKCNTRVTFAGDVTVPLGKDVAILGDDGSRAQLVTSAFKIKFAATGSRLVLRNLRLVIESTAIAPRDGTLLIDRCNLSAGAAVSVAMIKPDAASAALSGIRIVNSSFVGQAVMDSSTTVAFLDGGGKPAFNIIVDNCTFRLIERTQCMVSLTDVRQDVRFTSCSFFFDDDIIPAATGAGLVLSSTDNTFATWGREVSGCSFSGTKTTLGTAALRGIALGKLSNLLVAGCSFRKTSNAIEVVNPNGTGHARISACSFLDTGLVVSGAAHDWIGSTFEGCEFAHTDLQFTCALVQDLRFTDCTFDKSFAGSIIVWFNVTTGLREVSFSKCKFYQNTDESLSGALRIATPTGATGVLLGVTVSDCEFIGGGSTTTDNAIFGLSLETYAMEGVRLRNNHFYDIQNVAYTGGANDGAAGGFRVVEIRAFRVNGLMIEGNVFNRIGSNESSAGGVLAMGRCLAFKPHINATLTGAWQGVSIVGNVFGDDGSIATPWTVDQAKIICGDWRFANNQCRYQYPAVLSYPFTADMPIDFANSLGVTNGAIVFSDNYFRPVNNTGAPVNRDIIRIADAAGNGGRLEKMTFSHNEFDLYPFDHGYTLGRGILNKDTNVISSIFIGNSATPGDKMRTNGIDTANVTGESAPTPPGPATAWTLNVGLKSHT